MLPTKYNAEMPYQIATEIEFLIIIHKTSPFAGICLKKDQLIRVLDSKMHHSISRQSKRGKFCLFPLV